KPPIPGIEISIRMMSGLSEEDIRTASSPEPVSPAISQPGQALTILWIPRRSTAWSSTTNTRVITWSHFVGRTDFVWPNERRRAGMPSNQLNSLLPFGSYLNDLIFDGVANQ